MTVEVNIFENQLMADGKENNVTIKYQYDCSSPRKAEFAVTNKDFMIINGNKLTVEKLRLFTWFSRTIVDL